MSLVISSAVAKYHADNVARIVGPNLFAPETRRDFFYWLDSFIKAPKDDSERASSAKKLVSSVSCDYSYRVVARHPFLLEGFQHKKNNDLPEAVSKVFGKLFSNYQGHDPYSKDDLENFMDSLVTLVGYDVILRAEPEFNHRRTADSIENSSRFVHT